MSRPGDDGPAQSIDICPDDLALAAEEFASGQSRLDSIASTLNAALQNASGMAGNDSYGQKFGAKYDPAANALFATFSAAVRATGQASTGLVTTANNYLKADHHSHPKVRKKAPALYAAPAVFTDITYPDAASAVGAGSSSMPSVLAKYWPNGHQDKLRDAARAYRTASADLTTVGHDLHGQVQSLTDNNSDDSVHAMAVFWAKIWQQGAGAKSAPLSAAKEACDKLASVCEKFASAIDDAHSSTEHKLAGAGIALGLTTALGIILTPFTGGGSDAGAAALDSAEAAGILGSVEVALDAAVTDISADMIADMETYLQAAADGVPEIETVDAETTEVTQALDRELAETEARESAGVGGRGGAGRGTGGGDEPPTGGGDDPPGQPEEWGDDDADITADRMVNHAPGRSVPGVDEDDLPEYLENTMRRPGYRLRPTPGGSPRMAWWDADTGTVVIREGGGGTFMQPSAGYSYFLKLIGE
ncbi:WXG100-like domain-containing protein [Streptomyces sp. DW26H14]|uniref:WXG100-like domain-containing protein n=1 Tax=Streptomyces sp. DW26H14 TaxID=3435395 RepID=UPI00403D6A58